MVKKGIRIGPRRVRAPSIGARDRNDFPLFLIFFKWGLFTMVAKPFMGKH